jgi:hypothetical protein
MYSVMLLGFAFFGILEISTPLRDMLVAHASSGRKIPCRERDRIYEMDHLAAR